MVDEKYTEDKLQEFACEGCRILADKKAIDTRLLDLKNVNNYFDYFLITTGNSHVHCRSLARELDGYFSSLGLKNNSRPDLHSGWIVLDYNEIIVHVFTSELRDFYQLERLWADADVIEY